MLVIATSSGEALTWSGDCTDDAVSEVLSAVTEPAEAIEVHKVAITVTTPSTKKQQVQAGTPVLVKRVENT